MILALLIAATPPSSAYVEIRNQGVSKGYARVINCSGGGITCTVDAGANYATFTIASSGSDGGLTPGVVDGGACASGQYATAIDIHGAPTCSAVSYSQLSGSPLAGGSNTQVQYNNSGVLGGTSNVTTDGTRLNTTGETTFPAAPASGTLDSDFQPSTEFPHAAFKTDSTWAASLPVGWARNSLLVPTTGGGLCAQRCNFFDTWGINTFALNVGTVTSITSEGTPSTAIGWDAGTLLGRQRRAGYTNTGTLFTWIGMHSSQFTSWRGNTAGAGGFVFWARMFYSAAVNNKEWTFVGLANTVGAFGVSAEPSTMTNVVYFGCDAVDTTLHICSNDSTGTATCSDLGSNFPCETANAAYDFWLAAPPNGTTIGYYIERLDSAQTASGSINSDLPGNYLQLAAHVSTNNADSGVILGVMPVGYCTWDCW